MKGLVLIALAFLVACAGTAATTTNTETTAQTTAAPVTTSAPTTAPPTTAITGASSGATISASDFAFSPSGVTINAGETVTWNLTEGAHTSTSGTPPDGDGLWAQTLDANTPFTFTFDEPGEYPFFCRFHPDFMTGTVVVEP